MGEGVKPWIDSLRGVAKVASDAFRVARSDEEVVDVLGEIRSLERALGVIRRTHASETPADTAGAYWAIEIGRVCDRSYNTPALLRSFLEVVDGDLLDTVLWLLDQKAVLLTWNWTKLRDLAVRHDVELRTTNREITDDDLQFHVGEVWKDGYPKYVPVTE